MFLFVIRYLGFLKFIPGLGVLFDGWLKIYTLLTKPDLLDWIDEIEAQTLRWPGISISTHKYGGMQINCSGKEVGHIHSNGLLDMLLSRNIKSRLMLENDRIQEHHSFKNTGWISLYIHTEYDLKFALKLLRLGYERIVEKELQV
jgi:Luciferase